MADSGISAFGVAVIDQTRRKPGVIREEFSLLMRHDSGKASACWRGINIASISL